MRFCQVAIVVAAIMAVGCGDEDSAPVAFDIGTTSQALLVGLASVRVQLHAGDVDCVTLRLSTADVIAPYFTQVDLEQPQTEAETTLFNIVEGEYTPDAWGFGPADVARAHGCGAVIRVERGKLAEAAITLEPLLGR